jgi:hypothetical protein
VRSGGPERDDLVAALAARRHRDSALLEAVGVLERLIADPFFAEDVKGLRIAVSAVKRMRENDV